MSKVLHSLRFQTSALLLSTLLISFAGGFIWIWSELSARFEGWEQREIKLQIARVAENIGQQIALPALKIVDWAEWTDAFDYLEDKNVKFELANLVKESVMGLELSAICYFKLDKRLYASVEVFPDSTWSLALEKVLGRLPEVWPNPNVRESKNGLLKVDGKYFIFASRNVVPSDRSRSPNGFVFFFKAVDESMAAEVSRLTKIQVSMTQADRHAQLDADSSLRTPVLVEVGRELLAAEYWDFDLEKIHGVLDVKDVAGRSALQFAFTIPRDMRMEGRRTLGTVVVAFMMAIVVTFLVQGWGIQKLVLAKLFKLKDQVVEVAAQGFEKRVQVTGHGEIAQLAEKVNHLMEALAVRKKTEMHQTEKIHSLQLDQALLVEKQASEKALRMESDLRFKLAAMMAHRINNPLNYISLGLSSARDISSILKQTLFTLLGDEVEAGSELFEVQAKFKKLCDDLSESMGAMESGLSRAHEFINEIRSLSGIDGVTVERFSARELWRTVRGRIWELDPSLNKDMLSSEEELSATAHLEGHHAIYQSALEALILAVKQQARSEFFVRMTLLVGGTWQVGFKGEFNWDPAVSIALNRCLNNILSACYAACLVERKNSEIWVKFRFKGQSKPLQKVA